MTDSAFTSFGAVPGPAVERDIAIDMAKRSLWILPILVGVCAAIWGVNGGLSAAFAVGLVVVNLLLSAALLTWAARIGLAALMGAAMFGYLIRLGLITIAVLLVKDQSWVELVPLGLVLIATHLGLLVWELRHISVSFSSPGLKSKGNGATSSPSTTISQGVTQP
jgi:hypothetical protein